jgi:hypothetical protein
VSSRSRGLALIPDQPVPMGVNASQPNQDVDAHLPVNLYDFAALLGLKQGIDAPAIELEPFKDEHDLVSFASSLPPGRQSRAYQTLPGATPLQIGRVYTHHVYTEGSLPNPWWVSIECS